MYLLTDYRGITFNDMAKFCFYVACNFVGCVIAVAACLVSVREIEAAAPNDWKTLSAESEFADWRGEHRSWRIEGGATADKANPQKLRFAAGEGVLGSEGEAANLESKEDYQDVDVRLEFIIPQGSNSGVKLMGRYEIQILDTHDTKEMSGDVCGGVYPRAEEFPTYHHIDHGVAPRVNAAKPAGQWQRLEIKFIAPRFDSTGKKVSNAKFERVTLNGELIHENVEVAAPTGAAWRLVPEAPRGPLLLQGDHGPVAFRKIEVRPHAEK